MVARGRARRHRPLRRAGRPGRRRHHQLQDDHEPVDRSLDLDLDVEVVDEHHHRHERRDLGDIGDDLAHHCDHHHDDTERLRVERIGIGDLRGLVMGALIPNSTLWYTARGTGFVAVILLTLSVALGIVTTMRWSAPRWPRFITATLHKNISLLAVVFLATHIASTLFDSVSPVHLLNAIVPFTGRYRPLGVGLGVVAVDLLAALVITSLLRQRIGYRIWRAVHWSAYACWPIAMLHGLESGTDAATTWARVVYLSCAALVGVAVTWRVVAAQHHRAPSPPTARTRERAAAYSGVAR